MYTQRPILDLLALGKLGDETASLQKHIETVMSNVFVFPERTYKLYKNDNAFINKNFRDISGKNERLDFTRRDFLWNQELNSDIYVGLKAVAVIDGQLCVVDDAQTQEYIIVMNTFPEESVLINVLGFQKTPAEFDAFRAGARLAVLREKLPTLPFDHLNSDTVLQELCEDIYNWSLAQKDKYQDGELERYCDFLKRSSARNTVREYFRKHLSVSMDIHMGNALFYQEQLMLIDTFSPKESWFIKFECCDVYRLGTDIRVFMGEEAWELFENGYYSSSSEERCPRDVTVFSTIYASLIMVSYLYSLGGKHSVQAEKYLDFLRAFFRKNCQ